MTCCIKNKTTKKLCHHHRRTAPNDSAEDISQRKRGSERKDQSVKEKITTDTKNRPTGLFFFVLDKGS